MRYLLDTNVFVYIIEHNFNQLSTQQKEIIANPDNIFFVSEATYYELSIKIRLNKQAPFKFNVLELDKDRKTFNINLLKSKTDYYLGISDVPKVYLSEKKRHGDPFDLLIISQAIKEKMTILSSDRLFPYYKGLTVIN